MQNVLIIGCGRHGRMVAEAIAHRGEIRVVGFADDDPAKRGTVIDGVPVLGPWRQCDEPLCCVAVGHNAARRRAGCGRGTPLQPIPCSRSAGVPPAQAVRIP